MAYAEFQDRLFSLTKIRCCFLSGHITFVGTIKTLLIMRTLALLTLILSLTSCSKLLDRKPQHFGEYGQPIDIMNTLAVEKLQEFQDGQKIMITTTIEKTCVVKGCWMEVKDGQGGTMRVTFKDYGFFVPTEGMEGKETVIEGILEKRTYSVDELRHFAEDAGKSEAEIATITEPKEEFAFVADGVVIK